MSLESILALLASVLERAGVPYMLTGSLAGSYHGAPRATQDVDLVVQGSEEDLLSVASDLRDAGLYVSDDAVRDAVASRGMFNAIDPDSGWKADFILRKDRPFSLTEFERRRTIDFMGRPLAVARAEDVIVSKLEWAKLGDSERQLRDAAEILSVQGDRLDLDEIGRWADELGVRTQWLAALELSELQ